MTRRSIGVVAVAVLLVLGVARFESMQRGESAGKASPEQVARLERELRPVRALVELDGSATGADITADLGAGISQFSGKAVPLRDVHGTRGLWLDVSHGQRLYFSAQNTGDDGTLHCRIKTDAGSVIAENWSSGGYSTVTCAGVVP